MSSKVFLIVNDRVHDVCGEIKHQTKVDRSLLKKTKTTILYEDDNDDARVSRTRARPIIASAGADASGKLLITGD